MSIRPLLVPLLAAALLSSGCIAAADDEVDAMEIGELPTEPMDTWTGQNGAWPPYWQLMLPQIPAAFQERLTDPTNPQFINPAILSLGFGQTGNPAGQEIFKYLVRCTIPPGATYAVRHPASGVTYQGGGILVGTDTWRTQPLASSYHNRVHACLMALLNGYDGPAPIAIEAPGLVGPSQDDSGFPLTEAAWVSYLHYNVPSGSTRVYRAYISDAFKNACPNYLEKFNMRICAQGVGNCGITVTDWHGACTTAPDGVFCPAQFGTVQALVTKVSRDMYADCGL